MDAAIGAVATLAGAVKVGEGAFGEAYRTRDGAVIKVVPMWPARACIPPGVDGRTAADVAAEAEVGLALTCLAEGGGGADATTGFAATRAVAVCRGPYSPTLAAEWAAWKVAHGSDNPDPAVASARADALHAILVCDDGGTDLERARIPSPSAALSILAQTTLALAAAERAAAFEHRDLHWGNVLVAPLPDGAPPPSALLAGVRHAVTSHGGLRVSLIDFTLSRIAAAGEGGGGNDTSSASPPVAAAWADLDADPAIFAGSKGDPQADTYRTMRKLVHKAGGGGGASVWATHVPATNALWLAYLASVLADAKPYDKTDAHVRALRGFKRRAAAAPSAHALVGDSLFDGVIERA